jgi:ankyrin repeat protein
MLLTDPKDDLGRIRRQKERRVGHTCEWLLEREEFSTWDAESEPQLLRLVGSPGIGKTVMSIFLVNELQRKVKRTPNTMFAYFFCDYKDKDRNTPTAILRSVIRQLLLQNHMLFEHIQSDFKEKKSSLFMNFDALWRILKSMLRDDGAGEVFVLVDALDECELSMRNDLLGSIQELFDSRQTGRTGRFKFLITYRPNIDDIENTLKGVGTSLDVNSGEINSDLSEYINAKVDDLADKRGYAPDLKNKVRDALRYGARDTFLWASLMLADLQETPQYEVEKKLKTLPKGLDDTYARILAQIPDGRREDARFLLLCMVAARRPLKMKEIATAFGTWRNDLIPPSQDLDKYADICSACNSIIYLDKADDDKNPTVNFLHQSVKDFLLRDRPGEGIQWYHTSLDGANLLMFQVCWKYLSMEEFEYGNLVIRRKTHTKPHFQEHSFLEYASKEWEVHAVSSYPALLDSFEIDLQKAPTLRDAWLLRTAQEGQEEVLKRLLGGGADPASQDRMGRTPLSWAAGNGHKAAVKLLLEKGADVESKDTVYGRTPLWWAAENRHEAMLKLLLQKGADVESRNRYGQTPLSWAAEKGHEAVVKLLLEKGADVESKDTGFGRTPLWWAAANRREAMVKLLLRKGADVESKSSSGRTPLWWAAANGHEAMVKLLLEKGADVGSKSRSGRTPLSLAAERGHGAAVKLLLEKGADVESKDTECGRTPLSWAAENGREAVVKLLLEKGPDVESKSSYGRTPLSWAAEKGHKAVVKLLLEKGAEAESKDTESGRTPLSWAAEKGHKAVVMLLLKKRAGVESKDTENGRTPLSWAAENGREAVVKPLLEKCADVESKSRNVQTPLSWAAENGREAVVKPLLEKCADVESKPRNVQTPLSWAAEYRREAVVKLRKLKKGAEKLLHFFPHFFLLLLA